MTEQSQEKAQLSFREELSKVGFSDLATVVAAGAAKVGARKVLAIHGSNSGKTSNCF